MMDMRELPATRYTRRAPFILVLSLLGLALSAYLAVLHLALLRGELLGGPVCGDVGTLFNCYAVSASRFGQIAGLPLAFWGLLGYLATLTLAVIAWQWPAQAAEALTAMAGVSAACLLVDVGLLMIMVTQLHTLCAPCLGTDLITLALFLTAASAVARPWPTFPRRLSSAWGFLRPARRAPAAWLFWGVLLVGAAGVVAVHTTADWMSRAPGGLRDRILERARQAPRVAVETSGSPRLGSAAAPVEIVTFTDYDCPLCREATQFTAIVLAAHRGEVSLVVKQFPLDRACNPGLDRTVHPGACELAAAAACAQAQGEFWVFHDRLFRRGPALLPADLEATAAHAGLDVAAFRACLASGRGAAAVARDVAEGARLGVIATPTTFVNGIPIRGAITPAQYDALIEWLRREERPRRPLKKSGA